MPSGSGTERKQRKQIMATKPPGLYANIAKKQERIANGSKEVMRKPGAPGAPTPSDFKKSALTAKKK